MILRSLYFIVYLPVWHLILLRGSIPVCGLIPFVVLFLCGLSILQWSLSPSWKSSIILCGSKKKDDIFEVVTSIHTAKRAQTIWDFTSKFPDSLTVERWLYDEGIYCKSMKCKAGIDMRLIEVKKDGQPNLTWKCTHRPSAATVKRSLFVKEAFSQGSRSACIKFLVLCGSTFTSWNSRLFKT
ncbi:hypothetical protein O0I10_012678 [Lichtheimia ornata]|uniref:Uncharacterized protein n=1 Tax=Lichtheimia ornata TaxID=688661 RepID=A0AAD7URG1_9FUNG|nr:uncharacterized protein O0I10_012678 [Lichtheimia ornata]KAJ8651751.1 hypothetical protein O0I10_012678 [Lichtheimia ornata]